MKKYTLLDELPEITGVCANELYFFKIFFKKEFSETYLQYLKIKEFISKKKKESPHHELKLLHELEQSYILEVEGSQTEKNIVSF
jgi:hypothetical protein